ncbi:MAG: isochorismate synthase [Chloroflexi bacterium]|jgi:isochorismate synthase|nr:isochorismate synthase [Chloroflexota bacterium]
MTVVDRRDDVAEAGSRAAALLRELAGSVGADGSAGAGGLGAPAPALASATVRALDVDPVALFEAARAAGLDPCLWAQPSEDLAIVGIDEAWAVAPAGPERFADAHAAWTALVRDARVVDESGTARGTGPLLLGGFAFDGHGGTDPTWDGFGAGRLVLPRISWARTADGAWLTLNAATDPFGATAGPGGRSPRQPDPDALAASWADLASRVTAPATRRRATLRVVGGAPGADAWRATVDRYAGAVGRGRVDKVVLARRVDLVADGRVDVGGALRSLVAAAPESTVFAVSRGDAVFLGATPERLVRTEGRDARTVAIAGTAPRGADAAEDDALAAELLASEKEREEHAVVVRMLRESLGPLCDTLDVARTPRVIRLRTVQHLCTDVTARTSDRSGILSLAAVLHPTPAVGGQPRAAALDLIRDQEPIDRGWYAGPLGWLDRDSDGELVVALRSGVVRGDRVSLFAGCGIVADSDPGREWEESRIKLRALGGALGSVDL